MENKNNIIRGINAEVKSGLSVDKKTFRTCMNLVAIHAQNEGIKGMIVRSDDLDFDEYSIRPLMTEEAVDAALYGRTGRTEEED